MTRRTAARRRVSVAAVVLLASAGVARADLRPDELALIVNSNEPAGAELAAFYVRQRVVPDNRILVLDLPKGDEITPKQYAEQVVPRVREFLHSGGLDAKVKCLVPVYGVPLRIGDRHNTRAEQIEVARLRTELEKLPAGIRPAVETVEALGRRLDPTYTPDTGQTLEALDRRWTAAVGTVSAQLPTVPDPTRQAEIAHEFFADAVPLLGVEADLRARQIDLKLHPDRAAADGPPLRAAEGAYRQARADAGTLEGTPEDADARVRLRRVAKDTFGLVQYARLLHNQLDYLDERHGPVAFDSELSLVRWTVHPHNYVNVGGRQSLFPNPLFYTNALGPKPPPVPTLMVTRLDGPSPDLVKAMIATSVRVEDQGLRGKIVIDSLGEQPGAESEGKKGYGAYDQTLRNFNDIVSGHPGLDVVFDGKPDLLPAHSVSDVAVYVGWYAVNGYVPCCSFAGGAVAMHVASYTMTTLRPASNPNWAAGLLADGAVATIGPVAEPYTFAFPQADDFFPLLLTGKLTLAECYWRTQPVASWRMVCVGDPLYTPYRAHPALAEADLPLRLRGLLRPPAAAPPATSRATP